MLVPLIVAVPPVRAARDAGLLEAKPMFSRLTADGVRWDDGSCAGAAAIIWCTGFRPALAHLATNDASLVVGWLGNH